jgi:YD repeat-containing protein
VDVSKRLSFESKTPNEVNNFGTEEADEFVARASGYCPMVVAGKKYCRIWGAEFNALSGGYDDPANAGGEMESNSTLTSTLKVTIVPATDVYQNPDDERDDDKECIRKGLNRNHTKGFARMSLSDPVLTRGYPLKNNIHLTTLASHPTNMGNLNFSYGLSIRIEDRLAEIRNGWNLDYYARVPHYILLDGNGSTFNFGRSIGSFGQSLEPSAIAGSGAALRKTSTGFILENAGPPKSITAFGRYTYTFENTSSGRARLTSLTDEHGNVQQLFYENNVLSKVEDLTTKRALLFNHNPAGLISAVIQNGGPRTTITYNANNLATAVKTLNIDGSLVHSVDMTYDDQKGLLSSTTFDGDPAQRYMFSYVERPGVFDTTASTLSAKKAKLAAVVSGPGLEAPDYSTKIDQNSVLWTTAFRNAKGTLIEHITHVERSGPFATTDTSRFRVRTSPTDGTPVTEEEVYVGRASVGYGSDRTLVETTSTRFGSQQERIVTATASRFFNLRDQLIEHKEGGRSVTLTYDDKNRLTLVKNRSGNTKTFEYTDPVQPYLPTALIDSANQRWQLTYNRFGQPLSLVLPQGSVTPTTRWTYYEDTASPYYGYEKTIENGRTVEFLNYDLQGNLTESSDGFKITTTYDALHRPLTTGFADGAGTTTTYAGTRLESSTDENGRKTSYSWCPGCEGLEKLVAPLNYVLKWTRDDDFNITSFVDASLHATTYTYNGSSELTETTYPDGTYERFLSTFPTDTLSKAFFQQYLTTVDARNLPVTVTLQKGYNALPDSEQWGTDSLSYGYTHENYLANSFQKSLGSKTYTYDALNRVTEIRIDYRQAVVKPLLSVQTINFTYSPDGFVKQTIWKSGATVVGSWSYDYNAQGALSSLTTLEGEVTLFSYDAHNRLIEQNNTQHKTVTRYEYSSTRGWLTRLIHARYSETAKTPFADLRYSYDKTGNITAIEDHMQQVTVATATTTCRPQITTVIKSFEQRIVLLSQRPNLVSRLLIAVFKAVIKTLERQCQTTGTVSEPLSCAIPMMH